MGWVLIPITLVGADWTQFRGPNGAGVSTSRDLPEHFDAQKNVLWRTALPPGHSSPVFTDGHIFVTAFEGKSLLTICLDRASGKVLWRREAPRERQETFQEINTPASPTPVTDGTNVYVFFGDFGLLSYGPDGNERWRLPMGPFNNANGHGSSPILADGRLVLICDQDTGSYVIAVDRTEWARAVEDHAAGMHARLCHPRGVPAIEGACGVDRSGILRSGVIRRSTPARNCGGWAAWHGNSSPYLSSTAIAFSSTDGRWVAIRNNVAKSRTSPRFLQSMTRITTESCRAARRRRTRLLTGSCETDLNHDGYIDEREWQFYQTRSAAENCLVAIRAGGRGDVSASHVLWRYRKALPNTPSPLLYQGVIYLIRDGIFTSLNPENGEVYKQARLTGALGRYWSSPIAADGRIFVVSEEGKVVVLRAVPEWEILAVNNLDEDAFATPAILDGRIYVRTRAALYCFGKR